MAKETGSVLRRGELHLFPQEYLVKVYFIADRRKCLRSFRTDSTNCVCLVASFLIFTSYGISSLVIGVFHAWIPKF